MRGFMFRNAKGALFFAAITVLGVVMLVGSEDNQGALLKVATDLEHQNDQHAGPDQMVPRVQGATPFYPTDLEFSSDEDLIDDAKGFDPSPESDASSGSEIIDDSQQPTVAAIDTGDM